MVVTEQQRTVAAVIVDVAVAIDVPFVGARATLDVEAVGLQIAAMRGLSGGEARSATTKNRLGMETYC
jgi:hypothetical protein